MEKIKEQLIFELDITYKNYINTYGRINYVAWLNINRDKLFDYSIVRETLRRNILNPKTLESAITTVRKELKMIDNSLIGCFDMLEGIRRCIKNYQFNYSNIPQEVVMETIVGQELYFQDN